MGEQAATPVAATAVLSPPVEAPVLQRKCDCGNHTIAGGECDSCKKEKESGGGHTLQRAATSCGAGDEVPSIVHDVLSSPGQPLDAATRSFFEPRFGRDFSRMPIATGISRSNLKVGAANHPLEREADRLADQALRMPWPSLRPHPVQADFSRIRIHADARAADSSRAVSAKAYTVGSHIVFGAGQYAPTTTAGRHLLAHELAHTMQQGGAPAVVQRACDPSTGILAARSRPIFFPNEPTLLAVYAGTQTLTQGPTASDAVGLVQQALVDLGVSVGTGGPNSNGVTRVFDADTKTGIAAFQTSEAIPGVTSGVLDQATLKCLDNKRAGVVVQPHQTTVTASDVRVRLQDTSARDEDLFFSRGDATLDSIAKAKIGRLITRTTNPLKGCPINLEGYVSEDEFAEFGAALATSRINAVGAEFAAQHHDDPGPNCPSPAPPIRTASNLASSSTGVSDYRSRRTVEVVPSGATSTTAPCPAGAAKFRSLTSTEDSVLKKAIDLGKKWMKKAIDKLTPSNSAGNSALTTYFGGTSNRSTIKSNLTKWRNHLSSVVSVNNRHGTDCNATCRVAVAFNDGTGPGAQMTICPPFFQPIPTHPSLTEDEKKAFVIMHEAGHGSIDTRDTAYGHRRLIEFLAGFPSIAETNTDSYTLMVLCLNGFAGFCTAPTSSDPSTSATTALSTSEQIKARRGLAWLQTWMTWTEQDTASLYGEMNVARESGQGLSVVNSYYASVYDVMVAAFNFRRPAGDPPPTFGEQTAVAGILDRIIPMKRASAAGLTVDKDASTPPVSKWEMGPARQLSLGDPYFALTTDRERVEFLLPLIIHANSMISLALEPLYETYIKKNVITNNNNNP